MKTNCLKLLLIALCCAMFQNCSKDEASVEKQTAGTIKVKQGRLSFDSEAHFKSVFNELMQNQDNKYLSAWEEKYEGFTSMKTAYNNLSEADFEKIGQSNSISGYENILQIRLENGEKEAAVVTDHPILARMFNQEGLLLIGNNAFKLQKDKLIKIDSYNEDKIRKVLEGRAENSTDYLRIENQVVTQKSENLRVNGTLDLEKSCHDVYNSKYAFKGIFILIGTTSVNPSGDWTADFSGMFNSVIFVAQHRKRTLGIWFAKDTGELRLSGSVAYIDGNGSYQPGTLTPIVGYNTDEIGTVHGWGTNYRATASVTASGIGSDGGLHGCTETR